MNATLLVPPVAQTYFGAVNGVDSSEGDFAVYLFGENRTEAVLEVQYASEGMTTIYSRNSSNESFQVVPYSNFTQGPSSNTSQQGRRLLDASEHQVWHRHLQVRD